MTAYSIVRVDLKSQLVLTALKWKGHGTSADNNFQEMLCLYWNQFVESTWELPQFAYINIYAVYPAILRQVVVQEHYVVVFSGIINLCFFHRN
jgi:hypothetical protein